MNRTAVSERASGAEGAVRFIADAMLGRLARWLRLLGYDTLYFAGIADGELIRLARQEGRIILTRDTHFLRKNIPECILIDSDNVLEQMAGLMKSLHLLPGEGPSRCASCNGALREADKEEVEGLVADYVYLNFHRFELCRKCGNVYWEGTQYRRLRETLDEIAKSAARKNRETGG